MPYPRSDQPDIEPARPSAGEDVELHQTHADQHPAAGEPEAGQEESHGLSEDELLRAFLHDPGVPAAVDALIDFSNSSFFFGAFGSIAGRIFGFHMSW